MGGSSSDMLGIILGGGKGERLFPLTKHRSKPAVPLAGKYRIVDIPVSNCINSDIRKVFVLTQFNSASLNQHIARTYRFDNFSQGFVNILAAEQTLQNPNWFQGSADSVRQSIQHFHEIDASHILILSGDQLYQMDYRSILEFHLDNKADITVCTIPVSAEQAPRFGIMKVNDRNQGFLFQEKPAPEQLPHLRSELSKELVPEDQFHEGRAYLASMGIYLFSKKLLIEVLDATSKHDFEEDIIPAAIGNYRVMSYPFFGYWADIGTIRSFYEANLDLTTTLPKFNFYQESQPIYTRARFLPGSKLQNCKLDQSVISEGSFLNGSEIRHSVIGIRSRIGYGTTIANSYVMGADFYETLEQFKENTRNQIPNIGIGNNAVIENAIVDMNARIGSNVTIVNSKNLTNFDGENFYVRDKIVVIPNDAVVPEGTII
jgi:glucose-1-phosphate adenylyltransferase